MKKQPYESPVLDLKIYLSEQFAAILSGEYDEGTIQDGGDTVGAF